MHSWEDSSWLRQQQKCTNEGVTGNIVLKTWSLDLEDLLRYGTETEFSCHPIGKCENVGGLCAGQGVHSCTLSFPQRYV